MFVFFGTRFSSSFLLVGTAAAVTATLVLSGCNYTPAQPPPGFIAGGGAIIQTQYEEQGFPRVNAPYANIVMQYTKDLNFNKFVPGGTDRSTQNFYTSLSTATWQNTSLRTPAEWALSWTTQGTHPECSTFTGNGIPYLLWPIAYGTNMFVCEIYEGQPRLVVGDGNGSTSGHMAAINLNSPPSTLTATGTGFDSTYSLPTILFFDSNGNEVAEMDATNPALVTSTQITVPADLAAFTTGTYTFVVCNMASDGSWYAVTVGSVVARCSAGAGGSCA